MSTKASKNTKINLRAVKKYNFPLSMHISNEKLINSNLNNLHTRNRDDQDYMEHASLSPGKIIK